MRSVRKMRSEHYNNYAVLCHLNTKKDAGWLVCSYLISGQCSLHAALKRFDPDQGTSVLKNHTKLHSEEKRKRTMDANVVTKVNQTQKKSIIEAAAFAVSAGLLPISFAYKNPGMVAFAKALVDAGRSIPVTTELDIEDMLPSDKAVRESIIRIAKERRERYRVEEPKEVIGLGGGVTSDGLKNDVNGTKYYDFTAHYFKLGSPHVLTKDRPFELVSKMIFLIEHKGGESAQQLRSAFDHALITRIGVELDEFMKNFTFVTDCASNMPCVVGASSSSQRVPFNEKWMGCISYQLNTAMKHAVNAETTRNSVIANDLSSVKTIVRIFKQGNWNLSLPDGYALIQEVETRFGTTFAVVERFLKSSKHVASIIASKDSESAKTAFDSLLTETKPNGDVVYPALETISNCLRPVCHVQTALEAQSTPTIHLILPMLEQLDHQLKQISTGMAKGPNYEVPHALSKQFSQSLLHFLAKIEIHSMWVAGSLLHPRLRSLGFVENCEKRNMFKAKGAILIKRLLRNYAGAGNEDTDVCIVNDVIAPKELGKESFNLSDMFDIADREMADLDSFEKYMGRSFPLPVLQQLRTVKKEGEDHKTKLVKFWISQSALYPDLSKVALRLYATPVSSASSERNFSAVNRIVTADRSKLKSNLVEDMLYLRSMVRK
ncbi:zinc finger BED domain containing protein [Gracilaria domingensis]|nr:zinc finger BED domain containing protein [Gracilaria domingensis]